MAKTYDNTIVSSEVSLGIEQLFIALYTSGSAWTPAKIDIQTLAAGGYFASAGAVVEDTPTLTVTKEKYQLSLGLPKALQYEAVIGVQGSFAISVWAKSNTVAALAAGVDIQTIGVTGGTRMPFGRTTIRRYALLGITDFVDGSQVVHYFPDATVMSEMTEEIRPDEAAKIAFSYDMRSYISTIHGSERVIGERFYFT